MEWTHNARREMSPQLPDDSRPLRIYAATTTVALVGILVMGFTQNQKTRFSEIDVERINII